MADRSCTAAKAEYHVSERRENGFCRCFYGKALAQRHDALVRFVLMVDQAKKQRISVCRRVNMHVQLLFGSLTELVV
jgi:hypothetical protein